MSRRRQATDTLTGHWTQAELFGKAVWTGCDWPEEEQKAYKSDLRKAGISAWKR